MRISDWSSDVCSSDLEGPSRRAGHAGKRPRRGTCEPAARQVPQPSSGGRTGPRRTWHREGANREVRSIRLPRRLRACPSAGLDGAHRLHAVLPNVNRFIGMKRWIFRHGGHDSVDRPSRSEEHTSELQSLMRSSYAVFCLKKKQTTQINHTHTTK